MIDKELALILSLKKIFKDEDVSYSNVLSLISLSMKYLSIKYLPMKSISMQCSLQMQCIYVYIFNIVFLTSKHQDSSLVSKDSLWPSLKGHCPQSLVFCWMELGRIKEEIIDYGEDPLQLEPKRIERSKTKIIRYPCESCDYSATKASHLKQYIERKHEGIRYPCDSCEYTAILTSHLKWHIESKHEGVRYHCDQC